MEANSRGRIYEGRKQERKEESKKGRKERVERRSIFQTQGEGEGSERARERETYIAGHAPMRKPKMPAPIPMIPNWSNLSYVRD